MITQDFILYLGLQLPDEEKEKCLSTAIRMINLAEIAYLKGIISLEDEVLNDTTFLKSGINLMLEGIESTLLEKILHHSIISGGYTKTELLDRLIIAEGIVAIINFHSPLVMAHILGSIIGEKYTIELIETTNKTIDLNSFVDKYTVESSESIDFEAKLSKLTRAELSRLFMSSDNYDLAVAFKFCSKSFINKMRDGLSTTRFTQICDKFSRSNAPIELSLEHQNIILIALDKLRISGVIISES